jgi:hypothetical protein
MNKLHYALAIYLSCHGIAYTQENPDQKPLVDIFNIAKITALLQDDNLNPIKNVNLHIRFSHSNGAYNDGSNDFYLTTDADGQATAESESTGAIFIIAEKTGYYPSELQYQPTDWSKKPENKSKLLPWNPTVPITLKKIGKGAPMYARGAPRRSVYLPSQDLAHGYDLIEDDWLAPHGNGKVADLMIQAHMDVIDEKNYDSEMSITFPNKGNGWIPLHELVGIESQMKYPREAPEDGYLADPITLKHRWRNPYIEELPEGGHPYGYILRLRTKLDKDGKILSAIYAKIIDNDLHPPVDTRRLTNPIHFGSGPKLMKEKGRESGCYFKIFYYLNPKPNDRNLEFDRINNLAPEAERPPTEYAP